MTSSNRNLSQSASLVLASLTAIIALAALPLLVNAQGQSSSSSCSVVCVNGTCQQSGDCAGGGGQNPGGGGIPGGGGQPGQPGQGAGSSASCSVSVVCSGGNCQRSEQCQDGDIGGIPGGGGIPGLGGQPGLGGGQIPGGGQNPGGGDIPGGGGQSPIGGQIPGVGGGVPGGGQVPGVGIPGQDGQPGQPGNAPAPDLGQVPDVGGIRGLLQGILGTYLNQFTTVSSFPDNAPTWAAPPANVFTPNSNPTVNAFAPDDTNSLMVEAGTESPLTRVHERAYCYSENNWQPVELGSAEPQIEPGWHDGIAIGSIDMPEGELERGTYCVAHLCHWQAARREWKCGCKDTACETPGWNAQGVQRR